ncbi:MAG: alcohol dehydrogenase catalytic domain-containing protein [Acidimicrobiales bacterium]|jgi:(R,R)-butanediol dehydrogenase/meso-butanediol dehydrogenase/diacetyl reductase|nr:alcohol dehydrogenase catalytic domain-containing protein [Acidimicrobiales bacterium]
MRAAVLTESHGFEVVDLPDPAPEAGELLLRVEACGICGSDLKAHVRMPVGAVLGHEFCGEVVGIGAGVDTSWREGQLVAAMPLMVCGRCRWCQDGDVAHCERLVMLGLGGPGGGFAEYVRVDPTTSVRLPSDVGGFGALVEPLAVGLHSVAAARIRHGDRIAVIGGGNVGAAVAYWARRVGAGEVVVSDPDARRRSGADRFGATDVHDPSAAPLPQDFDVVFECVGIPGMLQAAIDAATLHGRVVVAGVCTAPDPVVPITAVMKELEMRFTVFYRLREFAAAAAVLADGAFPADAFVTTRIGLDGVGDAFTRLVAHASDERKVLVVPGL